MVRPRVRAVPRAHERRVVRVLEHRHREEVHLELDLADRREHAFRREPRVAPDELEQRRDVVALLVRRVPREAQHEGLGRVVEDHVDFARPRRPARVARLGRVRVRVAEHVRDAAAVGPRGVDQSGGRRRPRQLVEGHVVAEVGVAVAALPAGLLVDVAPGA